MYRSSLSFAALVLSFSPIFGQSVPLSFEPNSGQTDRDVRFLARAPGMIVYFTDTEIVMSLHKRDRSADPKTPAARALIRMKLAGARPPIEARGLDQQPGVSHYYIGGDPKAWQTNVPHYGRVSLSGVYDGIDLVSYGNQRRRLLPAPSSGITVSRARSGAAEWRWCIGRCAKTTSSSRSQSKSSSGEWIPMSCWKGFATNGKSSPG